MRTTSPSSFDRADVHGLAHRERSLRGRAAAPAR
jgi:hypothetical protein